MGRWLKLAEDMRDTGAYYEPRLDPLRLWWWYWSGRSVVEFMNTGGPVIRHGVVLPTAHKEWAEIALIYIHPTYLGRGFLSATLAEMVESPYAWGKKLFFFSSSRRVAQTAQRYGFEKVTALAKPQEWAESLGLEARLPQYLYEERVPGSYERCLYVRPGYAQGWWT